ncbi:hypothetical protein FS749_001058 [Ceratobasidium sp. UAMH 11750]|nr:hypothetical protein FS749_001058 [Ceratobasidium sp. UAMH 11750]
MSVNSTRSTVNGRLTDSALYQSLTHSVHSGYKILPPSCVSGDLASLLIYSSSYERRYLSYLITPRPRKADEPEPEEHSPVRPESSRLSALINFADLIPTRSDGAREVKFPKDFLPKIEEKMQKIFMGKDAA